MLGEVWQWTCEGSGSQQQDQATDGSGEALGRASDGQKQQKSHRAPTHSRSPANHTSALVPSTQARISAIWEAAAPALFPFSLRTLHPTRLQGEGMAEKTLSHVKSSLIKLPAGRVEQPRRLLYPANTRLRPSHLRRRVIPHKFTTPTRFLPCSLLYRRRFSRDNIWPLLEPTPYRRWNDV